MTHQEPEAHSAALPPDPWAVLDWRRRVAALYREVREQPVPAQAHAVWVAGRDDLLGHHPASPLPRQAREAFTGARVGPYDPAYRFTVPVQPSAPTTRRIPTGTDGTVVLHSIGHVELPGLGSLDLWWVTGYGGGIFLPLRDATSGRSTYGGGRYLLDTLKGADLGGDAAGGLVLDLNFAYMPSCAYDAAWACPLAGPGNTLPAAVPVGESLSGRADPAAPDRATT